MKRFIFSASTALLVLPILVSAHAEDDSYDHHMDMGSVWGGAGFFGGFFMILIWAAIVAAIVFLIKMLVDSSEKDNTGSPDQQESAEEILKKRYAKGEISKEELDEMKKGLGG